MTSNLLCSTSLTAGLGRILSRKDFPPGKTNLLAFNIVGFRIGLAGAVNPGMTSELLKGSVASIPVARLSDQVKFGCLGLLGTLGFSIAATAASCSLPDSPLSQRSHGDTSTLRGGPG